MAVGVDMSYNGTQVLLYRPRQWNVDTPKWQDDALCNEHEPALFELGPEDMDQDDQHELIAWGLQICAGCPVRAACDSSATELDRHWTTRGGRPPEGPFGEKIPVKSVPRRPAQATCRNGHDNWKVRRDGRRFCATCKKSRDADFEKNRSSRKH
jgi:Transcription factor WhiB